MKGLGRGFDSLIPTELNNEDLGFIEEKNIGSLGEIEIEKIKRDEDQPRREFDEGALNDLAKSISEHGVLQPIIVVEDNDMYKIVAGERRWRASKIAGLKKIPAVVRTMDEQKRILVSVIENAQREDLNALELANAYNRLIENFNLSISEVAQKIGKSETTVSNIIRLLTLPRSVQDMMIEFKLTEGVVRSLVGLPEETILKILPKIVNEGWSARKVEQYVKDLKPKSSAKAIKDSLYLKQESRLSEKYSAKAKIKGKTIVFTCKNEKELKELIERL